jgi:hypothetical protein
MSSADWPATGDRPPLAPYQQGVVPLSCAQQAHHRLYGQTDACLVLVAAEAALALDPGDWAAPAL